MSEKPERTPKKTAATSEKKPATSDKKPEPPDADGGDARPVATAEPRRPVMLPWLRSHVKALVLLGLAAVAVVWGYLIFPRDEPPIPGSNLTGVNFVSPVSLTSVDVALSKGKEGATLVTMTVIDDNAARPADSTISVGFQISANTWGHGIRHCVPHACARPDGIFKHETITFVLPKAASSAKATLTIPSDGRLGYGVRANDEYAAAIVPAIRFYLQPPKKVATALGITARLSYALPASDQYDWSGSAFPIADARSVTWQLTSGSGYFMASATNLKRQSLDSNELFLAGALLGASGAFLAAAVEEMI